VVAIASIMTMDANNEICSSPKSVAGITFQDCNAPRLKSRCGRSLLTGNQVAVWRSRLRRNRIRHALR
jgi:hypothetical protein